MPNFFSKKKKKHQIFGGNSFAFRRVTFATREGKKIKTNVPTNGPRLEGLSARKTGFLFFVTECEQSVSQKIESARPITQNSLSNILNLIY